MKKIGLVLLVLILIAGLLGLWGYQMIWGDNLNPNCKDHILYLEENSTFQNLLEKLDNQQILADHASFERTASLMKFGDQSIKPGRYNLENRTSNRAIIQALRSGLQEPVKMIINGGRTFDEVCKQLGEQLMMEQEDFCTHFLSENVLKDWNTDKRNIIGKILPNTYECYWNITPKQLETKLKAAYNNYWTEARLEKAKSLNLTPEEVVTLGSIVQKESNVGAEQPTIAGVYLNRLARGQHLQADPTVVFAVGDFTLRRVLNKHLEVDSPYNTYKYAGLPPGPICLVEQRVIEAVLNPEKHRYLYFCAKPDYSGEHNFAKTLVQHNRNANIYRRWLNQQNIK